MVAAAMRSFMLPVGFCHSSFTAMLAQPGGMTRRNSTSGVFPMDSKTEGFMRVPSEGQT